MIRCRPRGTDRQTNPFAGKVFPFVDDGAHCGYRSTLKVALRGHDLKHRYQSIRADPLRDAKTFGPVRGD